jgi:hypothetical protein
MYVSVAWHNVADSFLAPITRVVSDASDLLDTHAVQHEMQSGNGYQQHVDHLSCRACCDPRWATRDAMAAANDMMKCSKTVIDVGSAWKWRDRNVNCCANAVRTELKRTLKGATKPQCEVIGPPILPEA